MKLWRRFQDELKDGLGDKNIWLVKDKLIEEHELFKHFSLVEVDVVWRRFSAEQNASYLFIDYESICRFIEWLKEESF